MVHMCVPLALSVSVCYYSVRLFFSFICYFIVCTSVRINVLISGGVSLRLSRRCVGLAYRTFNSRT